MNQRQSRASNSSPGKSAEALLLLSDAFSQSVDVAPVCSQRLGHACGMRTLPADTNFRPLSPRLPIRPWDLCSGGSRRANPGEVPVQKR